MTAVTYNPTEIPKARTILICLDEMWVWRAGCPYYFLRFQRKGHAPTITVKTHLPMASSIAAGMDANVKAIHAGGTSCVGTSLRLTRQAVIAHASTEGNGRRLPSMQVLASILVIRNRRSAPRIHIEAFSYTPVSWYWTSTPYKCNPTYAWFVDLNRGPSCVVARLRSAMFNVRLVQ